MQRVFCKFLAHMDLTGKWSEEREERRKLRWELSLARNAQRDSEERSEASEYLKHSDSK